MIEFVWTSPIIIEETTKDYTVIELTLMGEGTSRHGIDYQLEETDFDLIAQTAKGKNIYYGTDIFGKHDAPPLKAGGQSSGEMYSGRPPIGKIIKAWVDKTARKVKAIAHIFDKSIREQIRNGWGISIRGITENLKPIIKGGRKILRAIKTRIHDIQLISPSTPRGMKVSKVDKVISETMEFDMYDIELGPGVVGLEIG